MFEGLRTVIYKVEDASRAKAWYTELLEKPPYFDQPFYVGFSVGGYELGLDPDVAGVTKGNTPVAYWGVADAKAAYARLIALGATAHGELQDVGGGILVGSVVDPFGNVVGIIENPHFKLDPAARHISRIHWRPLRVAGASVNWAPIGAPRATK